MDLIQTPQARCRAAIARCDITPPVGSTTACGEPPCMTGRRVCIDLSKRRYSGWSRANRGLASRRSSWPWTTAFGCSRDSEYPEIDSGGCERRPRNILVTLSHNPWSRLDVAHAQRTAGRGAAGAVSRSTGGEDGKLAGKLRPALPPRRSRMPPDAAIWPPIVITSMKRDGVMSADSIRGEC